MKKLSVFTIALLLGIAGVQAEEKAAATSVPHIETTIEHLVEVSASLEKELMDAKTVEDKVEAAEHIISVREAIKTLHALQTLHDKTSEVSKHAKES